MGGDRVGGQHSTWQKEKDGLRCLPRGYTQQVMKEVKGESRWSADGQRWSVCRGRGHREEGIPGEEEKQLGEGNQSGADSFVLKTDAMTDPG